MSSPSQDHQGDADVASGPEVALMYTKKRPSLTLVMQGPEKIKQLFYKWFFLLATLGACAALLMRFKFEFLGIFDLFLLPALCVSLGVSAAIAWWLPRLIGVGERVVFRFMECYFVVRLCNSFFILPAGADRSIEFNDIMPWMGIFILFAFWIFERRKALIEIGIFIAIGMVLSIAFFVTTKEIRPANYRLIVQQMLFANLTYAWLAYLFSYMIEAYTQENARAAVMQKMALTDPLTGVANRRQMELLLDKYDDHRQQEPFGLLLVDLDHFKLVNDNHGHQIGDQVLVAAARVMKHSLREGEALGRWGGEEFLVLLPGLSLDETEAIGERLRKAIHEQPAPDGPSITASIGVIHTSLAEDRNKLLQRADDALYQAKAQGRDQCVTWSDFSFSTMM